MAREVDVRILRLTPRGVGGIAVLAVAGADRAGAVSALLGDARAPGAAVDALPRLRWLWLDGQVIDQVLAFERPERRWVELHMHASEAVLRRIEGAVGPAGGPPSTPVETLVQAARDPRQLAATLEQRSLLAAWGGDFTAWVDSHRHDARALAEALGRSAAALAMAQPCALVLCGRKNAGKSTLMNRLLFHERVLTGPEPGLTRDPVGEVVVLDGYPYELIDTAGEGEATDAIDARAMRLGRERRADAWRLVLIDTSAVGDAAATAADRDLLAESERSVVVGTKRDLAGSGWAAGLRPPDLRVSCVDPRDAPAVRVAVGDAVRRRRGLPPAGRLGGVAAFSSEQFDRLRSVAALSSGVEGAPRA